MGKTAGLIWLMTRASDQVLVNTVMNIRLP